MKRKINVLPIVLVLLLTACIHKTGGSSVTPWERVTTYNAALAQANNTVEGGAEAVASSGLATPAQVQPIIALTGQVAVLHQQVTTLLATGSATSANIASVKALVDQIKASIQAVPVSALGIKNPKSQQSFYADVNNIGTLADAVLSSLQAINGGVTP
jgi:hypothetical protein